MPLRRRLETDLAQAMRGRDRTAVETLRILIAAIDNAGAVEVPSQENLATGFVPDVPRRELSRHDVLAIVEAEATEIRTAAEEYRRLGLIEEANRLLDQAAIAERYL